MSQDVEKTDPQEFAEERSSLWRITLAPSIWAGHFLVSYGATAIWCAKIAGPGASVPGLRVLIAILTLAALAGIAWLGWQAWKQWDFLDDLDYEHPHGRGEDRHEFLGHAGFLLAVLSFVGTVYTALPALVIETCR